MEYNIEGEIILYQPNESIRLEVRLLLMLSKRNEGVTATIYTAKISQQLQLDIEKHNDQYPPIQLRTYKESHDRFLLIDGKEVYHIGASLKDLGKKLFAFSKMNAPAGFFIKLLEK